MTKLSAWDIAGIQQCYRWMAPLYNALFARWYRSLRKESLRTLRLRPSDSVLLIGAGTGLDLPLVPKVSRLVAADISRHMLRRAKKARSITPPDLVVCDGGRLPVAAGSVSVVVLHLVLCASPDGRAILQEAARVLKPDGKVAVLDHFAHPGRLSRWRRWASQAHWLFGTRFDVPLEPMFAGLPLEVVSDRRRACGLYRVVLLQRPKHA